MTCALPSFIKTRQGAWFSMVLYFFGLYGLAAEESTAQDLYQRAHASLCLSCHSDESIGKSSAKDELLNQLKAWQNNPQKDHVMAQIARGLTDQQLTELADFFTRKKGSK